MVIRHNVLDITLRKLDVVMEMCPDCSVAFCDAVCRFNGDEENREPRYLMTGVMLCVCLFHCLTSS